MELEKMLLELATRVIPTVIGGVIVLFIGIYIHGLQEKKKIQKQAESERKKLSDR